MTTLIRLATDDDGAALARIYAPAVVDQATSFELEPPTGAEMARRVMALAERFPWLVCQYNGTVVGYAYASPHRDRPAYRWSVEVSAYIDASVHRAGVGRALYASLFAILKLQGFRNAYAGATLPNAASVGLHEAVGFTPVGVFKGVGYKMGKWHDVAWFERPLAARDPDPDPPLLLADVRSNKELSAAFQTALAAGLPLLRLA